jgi:hypothetical protein
MGYQRKQDPSDPLLSDRERRELDRLVADSESEAIPERLLVLAERLGEALAARERSQGRNAKDPKWRKLH